jgi:hypothetical protein
MELLDLFIKILGVISAILVGFYIPFANMQQKKRDARRDIERDLQLDEKLAKRLSIVIENLHSIELKVTDIERILSVHVDDDSFRKEYRTKIQLIASTALKNDLLGPNYKSIVSQFCDLLEKFGLAYYYSPDRKLAYRERKKKLDSLYLILVNEFEDYVSKIINHLRVDKGKTVQFIDFLKPSGMYPSVEILVNDLARNGLDNDKLIEKFEDCTDKFISDLISASVIWGNLPRKTLNSEVI